MNVNRSVTALPLMAAAIIAFAGAATGEDALVAGTKFHATAPIVCTFAGDAAVTQCEAGVIRHGGGKATVVVTFPDGYQRTLNFADDVFKAEAGGDQTATTKSGEMYSVDINAGNETFEIPDILIFGG